MTEQTQSNALKPKYITVDALNKMRYEVLEYIDDLDIAAEIIDIFDKYEAQGEEL